MIPAMGKNRADSYTPIHETGLYYLQSRYYNPTWGRFINADALVSTGQGILGNNMFAYCLNNPANFLDSEGSSAICVTNGDRNPLMIGHIGLGGGGGGTLRLIAGYLYFNNLWGDRI